MMQQSASMTCRRWRLAAVALVVWAVVVAAMSRQEAGAVTIDFQAYSGLPFGFSTYQEDDFIVSVVQSTNSGTNLGIDFTNQGGDIFLGGPVQWTVNVKPLVSGTTFDLDSLNLFPLSQPGSGTVRVSVPSTAITQDLSVTNVSAEQTRTLSSSFQGIAEFNVTGLSGDALGHVYIDDIVISNVNVGTNTPPTAQANGPYTFNPGAGIFNVLLDATGTTDPDETLSASQLEWESETGQTLAGFNPGLSVQETNLQHTLDTAVVTLTVTDTPGDTDTETATVAYANTAPQDLMVTPTIEADASVTLDLQLSDADYGVAQSGPFPADFEIVEVEFSTSNVFGAATALLSGDTVNPGGDFSFTASSSGAFGALNDLASASVTIGNAELQSYFGGLGTFNTYLNVRDRAGETASFAFQIEVTSPGGNQVPEAGTLALLASGLAGLAWVRHNAARRGRA